MSKPAENEWFWTKVRYWAYRSFGSLWGNNGHCRIVGCPRFPWVPHGTSCFRHHMLEKYPNGMPREEAKKARHTIFNNARRYAAKADSDKHR